jgi:aspartyl-tRNA synthetase
VKARFGYMLEAFRYGAPPHGGIALGFDRLIAILCNTPSIRDVIAFPKTAKGTCLMTDSPGNVEPKQLRDLHLELKGQRKDLERLKEIPFTFDVNEKAASEVKTQKQE